jgi:preprotein translocase subunit YajC
VVEERLSPGLKTVSGLWVSNPRQLHALPSNDASLPKLKKNDRVETVGGICGTVANIQKDSKYITLKIDETSNAKLKVLRSAILRVVVDDEPAESTDNAKT